MLMLVSLVNRVLYFYQMLIFVWVIMSWIPVRDGLLEDIYSVLDQLCEPYVGIFRRFLPPFGGLDFSPVVAVLLLSLLSRGLVAILL